MKYMKYMKYIHKWTVGKFQKTDGYTVDYRGEVAEKVENAGWKGTLRKSAETDVN